MSPERETQLIYTVGKLSGQVQTSLETMTRVENKLDRTVVRHDRRIRRLELTAAKAIGVIGFLTFAINALIAYASK